MARWQLRDIRVPRWDDDDGSNGDDVLRVDEDEIHDDDEGGDSDDIRDGRRWW